MKILIIAHPDDEMLWFDPEHFDKIIIVFRDRIGDADFNISREIAVQNYPIKNKIICLNYQESGVTNKRLNLDPRIKLNIFMKNWHKLELDMPKLVAGATEIYTHNQWGEFGHPEHVMINAVVNTYSGGLPIYCPQDLVSDRDDKNGEYVDVFIDSFRFLLLREFYKKYNIWTFRDDYIPPPVVRYYREMPEKFQERRTKIIID